MRSTDVTFKKADVPIETLGNSSDDDKRTMDIIEISYPDGKVVAFPADMKSPETGLRYRDMFPAKYNAFKNGEPDPDRVAQLQREIDERQAELDGMGYKAPDDERVKENLGYGETVVDENPHDATKPDPVGIEQPVLLGDPEPTVVPPKNELDASPKIKPAKEPA